MTSDKLIRTLPNDMDIKESFIKRFMQEGREYQQPYGPDCYASEVKKQECFDTLLKWTVEKKRGKVSYAKNILKDGFGYYSYHQQMRIIRSFLFLSPSDRKFAYRRLHSMWDSSIVQLVEQAWNEFHDEECSWLITRFFPKEYIMMHQEELYSPYNYYFICKRLGSEEQFVPDRRKFKSNITIVEYLEAVSMTQHPISEAEANEILYRMVSVAVYAHLANNERMMGEYGNSIAIDRYGHEMTMSRWFKFADFLIYNNDNFKEVLVYLCLMGHERVVEKFCLFCEGIKKRYEEIVGVLTLANPAMTGKTFISTIVEKFPFEYKYMLDFEPYQTMTGLNRRWRVMLQPQRRKLYGEEITMPFVSIENIPDVDINDIVQIISNKGTNDIRKNSSYRTTEQRKEMIEDNHAIKTLVEKFGLEMVQPTDENVSF